MGRLLFNQDRQHDFYLRWVKVLRTMANARRREHLGFMIPSIFA